MARAYKEAERTAPLFKPLPGGDIITTTPTTPVVTSGPTLTAGPIVTAGPVVSAGPSIRSGPVLSSVQVFGPPHAFSKPEILRLAELRTPPPALVAQVAVAVQRRLPDGGDVVFTLYFSDYGFQVGTAWNNECDAYFWVASHYQVLQAVDEWMNSEYESIAEMFYEHDPIPAPDGPGDEFLAPTAEMLYEMWENVVGCHEGAKYMVSVVNEIGIHTGHIELTAGWMMAQFGLNRESIIPTLIVADSLLASDYEDLYLNDDAEVYLNQGYVITDMVSDPVEPDLVTVHINPA